MKKFIKSLALILTPVMILGMIPLQAAAESQEVSYYYEVEADLQAEAVVLFELIEYTSMEFSIQSSGSDDITASFLCPNFLAAARRAFDKPAPEPILRSDVLRIGAVNSTGQGITSLAGIEHFTSLQILNVRNNLLTTLDISNLNALTQVYVSDNQLTSLILSPVARYWIIDVSNNSLVGENAVTGRSITWDEVNFRLGRQFTGSPLDDMTGYFKCPNFLQLVRSALRAPASAPIPRRDLARIVGIGSYFPCDSSRLITSFAGVEHLSEVHTLYAGSNHLVELDVSNNTKLRTLLAGGNQLRTLDVSNNPELQSLRIRNTQLHTLDVSNNTKLELLYADGNQLTSLVLNAVAPYWQIDVGLNYMASESAVTGRDIIWDGIDFRFWPQYTPSANSPANPGQSPSVNSRFSDVPGDNWQNAAVTWAYRNGITTGSPAGSNTFKPNDTITRAEFVTFFHRIFGSPCAPEAAFSDMPANPDFRNAISWAFTEGITTGSPAGSNTFMPNANITREQIAAMLYRYIGGEVPAPIDRLDRYADQHMISTWTGARDAVNWTVYHGIMGVGTTTLNPGGNATRAEAVAMLQRVVEKLVVFTS